jgi:hypothetical protein
LPIYLADFTLADFSLADFEQGALEAERPQILLLTRFLYANRYPPRIKCGAGFRLKTL